jgi:hypothetical protein
MASSPPNVPFRRDLIALRLVAWNTLLQCLAWVQLVPGTDEFRWNLLTNGCFTVNSMYKAKVHQEISVDSNKKIWKMKIPLKTKICVISSSRVILTKDNLAKSNWHASRTCVYCHQDKTIVIRTWEPQSVYRDLYTVGGHSEGYFLPIWLYFTFQ